MTLKVYPSAEHSRFTHGLGTLQAAQNIIDRIDSNRSGPHHVRSLLDEWDLEGNLALRWTEAIVLARLSALMHDIGHVPFGHTIEDDLDVLTAHDKNDRRFESIWEALPDAVRSAIGGATTQHRVEGRETSLYHELRSIVLDKSDKGGSGLFRSSPGELPSLYPFVGDIVNNTICADILDYLHRDHYFTGLPCTVGDRFMDNFYVGTGQVTVYIS